MDPFELTRALFGLNDATGMVDQTGSLSQPQSADAAPITPEAADPTTPTRGGRVLAVLPRNGAPPQQALDRLNPDTRSFGGALAAGMAGYKPELGKAGNFLSGLTGAMKYGEDRAAADQTTALNTYKTLADIQDRSLGREETRRAHDLAAQHQAAQLALTGKHYNDLSDYYHRAKDEKNPQITVVKDPVTGASRHMYLSGPNAGKTVEEIFGVGAGAGLGSGPAPTPRKVTPTEMKMIEKNDSTIDLLQNNINLLQEAKKISPQALGGAGWSGVQGKAEAFLGTERGKATVDLDNLIKKMALTELKPLLPGQISNYEDKLMQDLAGSSNATDANRQRIYDRGIKMMQKQLKLAQQRAEQLRGGEYFQKGGGVTAAPEEGGVMPIDTAPAPAAPVGGGSTPRGGATTPNSRSPAPSFPTPSAAHINHLRANPGLREDFDRKFGPGASDRVLKGGKDVVAQNGG